MAADTRRKMDHGLTVKEEAFAQAKARGLSGTQSAIAAGYSEAGASGTAVRINKRARVQQRIAELLGADKVGDARQQHLDQLAELRDMAKAKGALQAAVSAEEKRGKVLGLYEERVVQTIHQPLDDASVEDIRLALVDAFKRFDIKPDHIVIEGDVVKATDKTEEKPAKTMH